MTVKACGVYPAPAGVYHLTNDELLESVTWDSELDDEATAYLETLGRVVALAVYVPEAPAPTGYLLTITTTDGDVVLQESYETLTNDQVASIYAMASEPESDDVSGPATLEGVQEAE